MKRSVALSLIIGGLFVISALAQTRELCLTANPKPPLPAGHGTLDAVTSVIFRVEFRGDGTLGTITVVKGSPIKQLHDLASVAVTKIRFKPRMDKGRPVTDFKQVQYQYSWKYGWRVDGHLCGPRKVAYFPALIPKSLIATKVDIMGA